MMREPSSSNSTPSRNGRPTSSATSLSPAASTPRTKGKPGSSSPRGKTRGEPVLSFGRSAAETAGSSCGSGSSPSGCRTEPFYQARQRGFQDWGYRTPITEQHGFRTRFDALKAAAKAEFLDMQEAKDPTKHGAVAKVLRKHFFPNGLPA